MNVQFCPVRNMSSPEHLLFAMSKNNIYFVSHVPKNELIRMPNS